MGERERAAETHTGWRGFVARVGNPLDWPMTGKCALLAGINLVLYAGNASQLQRFGEDPTLAPFLDPVFVRSHAVGLWLVCLGWAVILSAGIALRRTRPDSKALVYSTVALYCVDNALAVYFVGPFTSPMVMLLFGAPLIAFVLFEQRAAFTGVAIVYVVLAATILAERAGVIPYAPLLREPPYENGRPTDQWAVAMSGQIFGLLTINVMIIAYIISQWRDRETKLAAAYTELRETQEQLVRSEALASIGSLVTGAAHELRNPLGSSGAMLQSLAEDLQNSGVIASDPHREDALETLKFARQGHARAQAIVERLYDLSDLLDRSGASVPVSRVAEYLRGRYPDIELETRLGEADPVMPERALRTIFDNLISNAVATLPPAPVRVRVEITGGALVLEIADRGNGIAPEHQAEVFRPFFTLEKTGAGHGVGLGLYVVHQLVTRLSGEVTLTSAPGTGTTVRVSLPL